MWSPVPSHSLLALVSRLWLFRLVSFNKV
ncbi:hypothetical protein GMOD_00007577 [Pyrenophora seminiperda CCB06]|uniref:Uncharacterized protein n=1 Tax=Pyrenophora seminiperda CCB06 TaxID=1302712 RepID=A0A3M7MDK6_9PLEO|nr:hypothetical protein GMOD_00007577 [Pyrenophora seminiperda CCB06]